MFSPVRASLALTILTCLATWACSTDENITPSLQDAGGIRSSDSKMDGALTETSSDLLPDSMDVSEDVSPQDASADTIEIEVGFHCSGKADCNDGNLCTQDGCEFASGQCFHDVQLFFICDDENPCTVQDRCNKTGVCVGETQVKCFDGNPCTLDTCDKQDGCLFINTEVPCNDGNACTENDTCMIGTCAGSPVVCNDKEVCTTDSCKEKTGCVYSKESNTPCDDNNACTSGDLCQTGACKGSGVKCGDGNSCTNDTCDKQTGCYSTPAPINTSCSDNDACTLKDVCVDAVCKAGSKKSCEDNNVCTSDACDVTDGACVNQPLAGIHFCNDNSACSSGDVCTLGVCAGKIVQCNDGNDCTMDSCEAKTGCQYLIQDKAPCSDGDKCTLGDLCVKDSCEGKVITCADKNACTNDTCDPAVGKCNFTATDGSSCSDGSACTIGDVCEGITCIGKSLACTDGNDCTDDSCNPKTGCFFVPTNNAPCSDDNLCTKSDICNQSVCVGKPVKCEDTSPCTNDSCDKATGACQFVPLKEGYSCNDGDSCTYGDACASGKCVGTVNDCDDKLKCTKDACNPQTGKCVNSPIPNCA